MNVAPKYHAHLDGCKQCANQPFNLCPEGARLLVKEGRQLMPNCLDGINQAPFTYEKIEDSKAKGGFHYRIADRADNRIATCYEEFNAAFIVDILNKSIDR
jgi:hypothetical protein